MRQETRAKVAWIRLAQLLGLLLFISFGLMLARAPVRAQETPTDATATVGAATNTVVRMEVDTPAAPLASGQEFPVRVLIDNVDHMAGFNFTITFDPNKVSYSRVENQCKVLEPVQGEGGLFRPDPVVKPGTVEVNCNRFAAPVCQGGPAGASGNGELGTVYFKSKGHGDAKLELTDSTLALDDVTPCDSSSPAQAIPHRRGDQVSIALAGGSGGGSSMAIIIGIVVAAAAVVIVAVGGFVWFRRRQAARPA